jgi:hypothetical protein
VKFTPAPQPAVKPYQKKLLPQRRTSCIVRRNKMSAGSLDMSTEAKPATTGPKALTVPDIVARKGKTPVVCLTAYSTPQAESVDAHCDLVLVGDSVAMVVHGLPSTVGATLDMMIMHGAAVRRGLKQALMVVDMPFGSYEESPAQAFRNCARVMAETGCAAVKIEGGQRMRDTIAFLTERGIPVMAHVGLTPHSVFRERVTMPPGLKQMPLPSQRPVPSPWCWKKFLPRLPRASPARHQSRPSASALRPTVTARSS